MTRKLRRIHFESRKPTILTKFEVIKSLKHVCICTKRRFSLLPRSEIHNLFVTGLAQFGFSSMRFYLMDDVSFWGLAVRWIYSLGCKLLIEWFMYALKYKYTRKMPRIVTTYAIMELLWIPLRGKSDKRLVQMQASFKDFKTSNFVKFLGFRLSKCLVMWIVSVSNVLTKQTI